MGNTNAYVKTQVAAAVAKTAEAFGARVVCDVTIEVDGHATPFDLILLDRHGLLVIDVSTPAALEIAGSSRADSWTVPGEGVWRRRIPNPFRTNTQRITDLKAALLICGRRIAPEYFSDLVVLSVGDASRLRLTPVERARVADVRELAAALQARYDFAVNPGLMDSGELDDLVSLLSTLDRSDSRGAQSTAADDLPRVGMLDRMLGRRVSRVALSDSAVGLAPTAPRLDGDRYPTASNRSASPAGLLVALLLLALLGTWLFRFGGMGTVQRAWGSVSDAVLRDGMSQRVGGLGASGLTPSVTDDQARRVLRESDPKLYSRIVDLGSPDLKVADGTTTYTFHYKASGADDSFAWVALSFDAAGTLRGVDGP